MTFTDFQKECIDKAKEHLRLIPRIDHNIRWKDMPGKVLVIIELLQKSKLSISIFSEELKISSKTLSNFTKGKDHSGFEWPELLKILKPEDFKKKEEKIQIDKKETIISKLILEILNRGEVVLTNGLRDDTIKTELKKYRSRYVSTILNRLAIANEIVKFVGNDKKLRWKLYSESNKEIQEIQEMKTNNKEANSIAVFLDLQNKLPEIVETKKSEIKVYQFPESKESMKCDVESAWKFILLNLKKEQVHSISESENEILIRVPFKNSCFDFPFKKWRNIIGITLEYFPKLCPHLFTLSINLSLWSNDLYFLESIRMTQNDMKLNSEQAVIDHFEALISLSGIGKAV